MLVLLSLTCYAFLTRLLVEGWTERGQFGDMFSAANIVFSGLVFAALFFAMLMQRKELCLQREELVQTRAEFAKQSKAQTEQSQTALRAAKISALGALLQSYTTWSQTGHANLLDPVS